MFDLVLNHCSPEHPWFQQFLRSESPGKDFFLSYWHPEKDKEWLQQVKRARNLPLLYPWELKDSSGQTKYIYCTYHKDLIDLNWGNPRTLNLLP